MAETGALRASGRGVALREETKELLSNSQRTNTAQNLSFLDLEMHQAKTLHNDNKGRSSLFHGENGGYTLDDLEERLRKLKVQMDSLASDLTFNPDEECPFKLESVVDSIPFSSEWPVALAGSYKDSGTEEPPAETERFLKPKHLLRSSEDYSVLASLGLPTFAPSPVNQLTGLLGSEIAGQNVLPSVDLTFPWKLRSPRVMGAKSLLPPKIPVRDCLPERASFSLTRSHSLCLDHSGPTRSRSFSPPTKRTRWLRSRSQSPRPVWRPSSSKANACAQPPPQLCKPRSTQKKRKLSRQSWSRIYRPGTLATRAWTPKANTRGALNNCWGSYSLPSAAISSPTAQ